MLAALMVAVALLAEVPEAGRRVQAQYKRMCGRIVEIGCKGTAGPMTFNVGMERNREFKAMIPAASRQAFGARAQDRYEDRTVCFVVRNVKDGIVVLESPSDIEVTSERLLPPVPAEVYNPCEYDGIESPIIEKDVKPQYPPDALKERIQGKVGMRLVVNADGTTGDVVVVQKLFDSLDAAAVASVKRWRFKPGTYQGRAVPVVAYAQIEFWVQ
jgi:TonB family protein